MHPKSTTAIRDLLTCALEGGSNYWYCDLAPHTYPDGAGYADFRNGYRFGPYATKQDAEHDGWGG